MTSGTAAVKTKTDTSDDKVDWIAEIRGLAVMLLAVFAFHSFIAKPFYIPMAGTGARSASTSPRGATGG